MIATTKKMTTTTIPTTAALLRRSRYQASCHSERCLRTRTFRSEDRSAAVRCPGVVVTVALAYIPSTIESMRAVREADRARTGGHAVRRGGYEREPDTSEPQDEEGTMFGRDVELDERPPSIEAAAPHNAQGGRDQTDKKQRHGKQTCDAHQRPR